MNGYIERKNMELNNKKVKELLPQKEPFRFVDYVDDVDKIIRLFDVITLLRVITLFF